VVVGVFMSVAPMKSLRADHPIEQKR